MTTSPHMAALDHQIDDLKRQIKAQTLILTNLINSDGNTGDADRALWGLVDLVSDLRHQRFAFGDLGQANTRALSLVDHPYGQSHVPEAPLSQPENEFVHWLNDLSLGGKVTLTKAEFEGIFKGDDAGRRLAAAILTEQCGCRLLFRDHPQIWAEITRKQRRSEVSITLRAQA